MKQSRLLSMHGHSPAYVSLMPNARADIIFSCYVQIFE